MDWMGRIAAWTATLGWAGRVPKGPGTAGSALALFLYFAIGHLGPLEQILVILLALSASLWSIREYESQTGSHDDGRVVVDELVGMWITLWMIPVSIGWFLTGFLLFRLLDILKPYPANMIDRTWPGARGVVFDDIVAGIYAQAILRLLLRLSGLL